MAPSRQLLNLIPFLDEKAFFYVFQNLFLEMKKLEIEETKVTYFLTVLKVVY